MRSQFYCAYCEEAVLLPAPCQVNFCSHRCFELWSSSFEGAELVKQQVPVHIAGKQKGNLPDLDWLDNHARVV